MKFLFRQRISGKIIVGGLIIFSATNFVLSPMTVHAEELDSDSDGYPDAQEISNAYSPFNPEPVKIDKSDMDQDGLSDSWELKFKTDPLNPDSDSDGLLDGREIDNAYDPSSSSSKKLSPRIEINVKTQTLSY